MSFTIALNSPVTLITRPAEQKIFKEITINQMEDNPTEKIVSAMIENFHKQIVLWEGEDYDTIGDWTNSDVEKRLLEIITTKGLV